MGERQLLPEIMNLEQFQTGMCKWSIDTLRRRVKEDGFPAFKDGGEWRIHRDKAQLWFEKRLPRQGR